MLRPYMTDTDRAIEARRSGRAERARPYKHN
jgi:hypothetical protein